MISPLRACLLCLAFLAIAKAAPGDQQINFQNVCKAIGPYAPMRGIQTQQFCSSSGLEDNHRKCALLAGTEAALVKLYESMGSSCQGSKQTPVNAKSPSGG